MEQSEAKMRDIKRIMKLRLLDDLFMKAVLHDNIPAVALIVRIVLNRQDIEIVDVRTQEELAGRIRHFKLTEGGRDTMCKVMEEIRQEGVQQGIQQGMRQGMQQGMQQGLERGIRASISLLREVPYSRETVIQKVMDQFQLTPQAAAEKVTLYWPQ